VPFPLPARLAAVAGVDPERRDWVAALPATVRELAERWALTVGAPFQPGGEVSWVAPARDATGRDLVLKVGWRHRETEHEAAGLLAWRERGAVWLHDAHTDALNCCLLLERARPGTSLATSRPEPEQDRVVAALLRRIWHEPAPGHRFPSLAGMCAAWADEFDQCYAAEPEALDPGLAAAGMQLYRGLAREDGTAVLLAADLHAGNVLAARRANGDT
jgi:streptomycin 6-kinase